MAPSPPYRRGSHRPRVDSQQEAGNPGRRNPQRQGVGRHCGRSTGVALSLMHTGMLCKKTHTHTPKTRNTDRPEPPPPVKPTRTKTRNEENTEPANERRRRKKKKKQVRGEALVKEKMKRYGSMAESASRTKKH